MLELSSYHLTNKRDQFEKMGIPEKQEKDFIEVEASKTDYNLLRKDLTHYLLKTFSENTDSEYPQRIFETGRVFSQDETRKIIEKENLSGAIIPGNFTELKQILLCLFKMLDINVAFKESENFQHIL